MVRAGMWTAMSSRLRPAGSGSTKVSGGAFARLRQGMLRWRRAGEREERLVERTDGIIKLHLPGR